MPAYTVKKTPGRKVTPEQLKRLIELAKQLDAAEAGYGIAYGLRPKGIDEGFFANKLKRQTTYLASDGKDTVGMALSTPSGADYDNDIDYINMVSVDKKHRGKGIGRKLLRAAILDSVRRNRMLMLHVNANNPAGMHLYESEGFTPFSHTMIYRGEKKAEDYTVADGDTLSGIAKRTGIPVQTIAKSNGIANPNRIRVGQKLVIPAARQLQPSPVQQPRPVQPAPQQHDLNTRAGRLNYTSDFLHRKFNNPNLEAAWLANINHETGGTFDPNTKEKGGTGYGMLQYTGASRKAYDAWLAKQKYGADAKGKMDAQLEYGTGQYMKSRPGYRKYTAPGAAFTRGQYADWIHRSVLTPAHVIKGNPHYSEAATARRNAAQQQFMNNNLRFVNGQWRAVGL